MVTTWVSLEGSGCGRGVAAVAAILASILLMNSSNDGWDGVCFGGGRGIEYD